LTIPESKNRFVIGNKEDRGISAESAAGRSTGKARMASQPRCECEELPKWRLDRDDVGAGAWKALGRRKVSPFAPENNRKEDRRGDEKFP